MDSGGTRELTLVLEREVDLELGDRDLPPEELRLGDFVQAAFERERR